LKKLILLLFIPLVFGCDGDSLMREKIKKTVSERDFSEEKIKQSIYNSKNSKKPLYFKNVRITSKEEYCRTQERITTELNNNPDNINQVLKKNITGIIGLIKYSKQYFYNDSPKYYQFPTRQEEPFVANNIGNFPARQLTCDLTYPEMFKYLEGWWKFRFRFILEKIDNNSFYEDDLIELDRAINRIAQKSGN